nr:conserved hypothetical protein [Melanopsichium pennsylvanicum 4]
MNPTSSNEAGIIKIHPGRERGRITLSIGSINVRYSRNAAYDSTQSMLSSLQNLLTAARKGEGPSQFASVIDPYAVASPYLMQQYRGERSWLLRGPKMADVPLFHDWDIFAFQEVLDGQYNNLINWLGEEYDHAGVGRDDGKRAGEAVPVFWRRDTFELVNKDNGGIGETGVEHFWLSATPEIVASVGWDAALTRMCTHVSLRLLATDEVIHVFSTHYDHQGVVARAKSSELIVDRARKASENTKAFYKTQSFPNQLEEPLVVLIGDLNSPRNEGSWSTLVSPHYDLPANSTGSTFLDTALSMPSRFTSPLLTDNEDPHRSELASGQKLPRPPPTDASQAGILSEPLGPLRTFTDFQPSPRKAIDDRIDFIMLLDNQAVLDQTRKDTKLDHSISPPPPQKAGSAVVFARQVTSTSDASNFKTIEDKVELKKSQTQEAMDERWRIRSFGTLPNWSEGDAGFLISDHRPVMARIQRNINIV